MVNNRNIMVWKGVTTKVIPLLFVTIGFMFVCIFTRPFVAWLDPVHTFYAAIFWVSGAVFFFEMGLVMPETIRGTGSMFAALLLGGIGVISFVYGFLTFFGIYDVLHDTGFFNMILTALMILQIGLFLMMGYEEIFHYRRFKLASLRA